MTSINGTITSVIYNAGQFFILEITAEGQKPFSAKGNFFGLLTLRRGMSLCVHGSWGKSQKYGRQFNVKDWEPFAYNVLSIKQFLSEAVPEFDYYIAEALVEEYGRDTFKVLSETPNKAIEDLKIVDQDDLKLAILSWEKMMAIRALSSVLQEGGISLSDIGVAVRRFGMEAPAVIKENPFRLMEIPGFSFPKVDRLAATLGFDPSNPCRLEGAILWALSEGTKNGHLYLRKSNIVSLLPVVPTVEGSLPLTDEPDRGITPHLRSLFQRGTIRIEAGIGAYLPDMHDYERGSAEKLARMVAPTSWNVELEPFLEEFEKSSSLNLSDAQKDAVRQVIEHKVLVLTGLPGTGKTTAVRALVRLFETARVAFTMMAPTGIAAKRLADVTGYPASTIHRALGYDGVAWKCGDDNKYITDAVIVDEVSMVDMELFYRLLTSLRDDTMLVLVGDDAQLPSVGPGNVLKELVACESIPSVRLTQIFRQSEGGDIVTNSHLINSGEFPVLADPKQGTEFSYIRLSDEYKIQRYIVNMAAKLKARDANFQVLAPKYDGVVGVDALNNALRDVLNPEGPPEWQGKRQRFRVGDRVMVTKNNYQKGVYNGDVGKLLYIGNERLIVRVYGVGNNTDLEASFTEGEAEMYLRLAYAITVHKSQGSEFDTILMPVVMSQGRMLQRNLLYTAVTRAKQKVWLLGEESAIRQAIANNRVLSRNTALSHAITGVLKGDGQQQESSPGTTETRDPV